MSLCQWTTSRPAGGESHTASAANGLGMCTWTMSQPVWERRYSPSRRGASDVARRLPHEGARVI